MRRVLIIVGIVSLVAATGAYLYLVGREYEFRFTEEQLQQTLSERLPTQKRYFVLFEVALGNPRVALTNGSDKLDAGLDVTMNIRLSTEAMRLGGTIDVSGGIRYDNQAGQFFVTDPVIENLSVQGVPEEYTERTNEVLTMALGEYFSVRPIYTLDTNEVKQAVAALVLKDVVVENEQLIVTLGI